MYVALLRTYTHLEIRKVSVFNHNGQGGELILLCAYFNFIYASFNKYTSNAYFNITVGKFPGGYTFLCVLHCSCRMGCLYEFSGGALLNCAGVYSVYLWEYAAYTMGNYIYNCMSETENN